MAVFDITGPDGNKYRVEGENAEGAMAALQQMLGQPSTTAPSAITQGETAPAISGDLYSPANAGLFQAQPEGASNLAEMQQTASEGIGADVQERIRPYTDPYLALLQGVSFGSSDELLGRLQGSLGRVQAQEATDDLRGQLDQYREDSPIAAYGTEIAGSMANPLAMGLGTIGTTGNLGARALKSGSIGGLLGGVYGFFGDEGDATERLDGAATNAALGGAVGAAIPLAGQAVQRLVNGYNENLAIGDVVRNAPTTAQLRAEGNAAYRQIDDAGVQISPQAFTSTFDDIIRGLQSNGLDELPGPGSLTPKSSRVVEIGRQMGAAMDDPTAGLPFSSLDQLRRQAGNAAADSTLMGRPTPDARLGSQVISGIDDFVENLSPNDVVAGDLETLQTMIPKAREIWGRMSRSQLLDDAIENGQNYMSGDASGLRNQFARILRNPQLRRGFDEAEIAAMRRVVNGSFPAKMLHLIGGGLGNLATMAIAGSTMNPLAMMAGAGIAAGTRRASDAVAQSTAEIARALVAAGGMRGQQVTPALTDQTRQIIEALLGKASVAPIVTGAH